ncbi:MAG: phosphoglucomutase/phosphomannomutase family protein [Firmicutes bacterium]|nr:phosphoglucomutase/phosphomannomutase family protein [Bacillota bacterium]
MKGIKFGTDGWRGIIADDFTFASVRVVSQAVADYVKGLGKGDLGLVVGYDNRFLSDRFAGVVADVLTGNGIKVYMGEKPLPTPVTAFAVKEYGTAGAVMLTASHNPPEYNGFKFIPHYAGPALPHITRSIEENIYRLLGGEGRVRGVAEEMSVELAACPVCKPSEETAPGVEAARDVAVLKTATAPPLLDGGAGAGGVAAENPPGGAVAERVFIDPRPAYFAHLERLVDMEAITKAKLQVMVDAMHGSGMGYLDALLKKAGNRVQESRCHRDPLFGGGLPEPSGQSLEGACQWIKEEGVRLGLALDGDADRFGIIDSGGVFVSPNQFLPLLYYHLINVRGMVGPVTRTVATTHMLDHIARQHGQAVYETAVGFKYIAQNLLEKGCVLGGEESGGLSVKGHIPEKDGILAGLLAAEMVAVHGKSLTELAEEVADKYGVRLHSQRLDVQTTPRQKQRVLAGLYDFAPAKLAGKAVTRRITLDGLKLVLESGEWVLVRPSGTEPLFRIYVESERLDRIGEIRAEFMAQMGLPT